MNYETNQLDLIISNTEKYYNIVLEAVKQDNYLLFIENVINIFKEVNKQFDYINNYDFEVLNINFKELFDYYKEYLLN